MRQLILSVRTVTPRTLRLGKKRYPVVLPTIRDPRLHLAAVIVSIHVLGQTALGFQVSVAQILVAIVTCAVIEVAWTLNRTGTLVWPASAMLTGSGVALIFRVIGTQQRGLLELARVVPVRLGGRAFPAHQVRDPIPGLARVQSVERGPRRGLPGPGQHPGGAARLLVGPVRRLDGGRLSDHPGGRIADHRSPALACHVTGVLGHPGRRHRHLGRLRTLHDCALGVRAGLWIPLLVGDRCVTGGLDLPVLHDHRPEDGAGWTGGATRLRRLRCPRQHPVDRPSADRIRRQGGVVGRPGHLVCGSSALRALLSRCENRTGIGSAASWPGSQRLEM